MKSTSAIKMRNPTAGRTMTQEGNLGSNGSFNGTTKGGLGAGAGSPGRRGNATKPPGCRGGSGACTGPAIGAGAAVAAGATCITCGGGAG